MNRKEILRAGARVPVGGLGADDSGLHASLKCRPHLHRLHVTVAGRVESHEHPELAEQLDDLFQLEAGLNR
jgi:hypothetical protein